MQHGLPDRRLEQDHQRTQADLDAPRPAASGREAAQLRGDAAIARLRQNRNSKVTPVEAASTRCMKWMRIPPSVRSGTSSPLQERPGGAGERGAALGGHRGAHHGEQRQTPGEQRRARTSGRRRPSGASPAAPVIDPQGHGQDQQRIAQMDRHRPGAVAIEDGEAAQGTLHEQQQDETATGKGEPRLSTPVPERQHGQQQDERADQHARDQAMDPLQHHLAVAVAEVRAWPRDRTAVAPSGHSRSASRGRTGRSWWSGPRRPGRSGRRSGRR